MLVLKLELHSAISHEVTEIGRMYICNDGTGKQDAGNYVAAVCKRGTDAMPQEAYCNPNVRAPKAARSGEVRDYPRISYNVWRLVARSVLACFPEERPTTPYANAKSAAKATPILDAQVMHGLQLLNAIAPPYRFETQAEVDACDAAVAWLAASQAEIDLRHEQVNTAARALGIIK